MARTAKGLIRPTAENLDRFGAEPITRWLISAALDGRSITYGEAKLRFEQEIGFSTIFPIEMGRPAGTAMNNILELYPKAPLLNALLVRKNTGRPGDGVGHYLAYRYRKPALREKDARRKHPNLWRKYCEKAATEVYQFQDWEKIYQHLYKRKLVHDSPATKGTERDGVPQGRTGEGKNHRALRIWVHTNPHKVAPRIREVRSETEVNLLSGDRVDVVYYSSSSTLAIEVKSKDSNWFDLQRGIYQCVKYRTILAAQDVRSSPKVTALLVTETELNADLKALARRLGVKHSVKVVNKT